MQKLNTIYHLCRLSLSQFAFRSVTEFNFSSNSTEGSPIQGQLHYNQPFYIRTSEDGGNVSTVFFAFICYCPILHMWPLSKVMTLYIWLEWCRQVSTTPHYINCCHFQLYLCSDTHTFQRQAKKSRHQEVLLVPEKSFLCQWQVIAHNPTYRLEMEGTPVHVRTFSVLWLATSYCSRFKFTFLWHDMYKLWIYFFRQMRRS